jgi:hypothetical protein
MKKTMSNKKKLSSSLRPFHLINEVLKNKKLTLKVLDNIELYSRRIGSDYSPIGIGIITFDIPYGRFLSILLNPNKTDFEYSEGVEENKENKENEKFNTRKIAEEIFKNQWNFTSIPKEKRLEKEIIRIKEILDIYLNK